MAPEQTTWTQLKEKQSLLTSKEKTGSARDWLLTASSWETLKEIFTTGDFCPLGLCVSLRLGGISLHKQDNILPTKDLAGDRAGKQS